MQLRKQCKGYGLQAKKLAQLPKRWIVGIGQPCLGLLRDVKGDLEPQIRTQYRKIPDSIRKIQFFISYDDEVVALFSQELVC